MADLKIDVIVDALLKGGKLDATQLNNAIQVLLTHQKFPDVLLDPKIKLKKGSIDRIKSQLDEQYNELSTSLVDKGGKVSDRFKKMFEGMTRQERKAQQQLVNNLRTAFSTEAIEGPRGRKFVAPFRQQMDEISKGVGSVFDLSGPQKQKAKEYLKHLQGVAAHVETIRKQAGTILGKTSDTGTAGGRQQPRILAKTGVLTDELTNFNKRLGERLDEKKQLKQINDAIAAEEKKAIKEQTDAEKKKATAEKQRIAAQRKAADERVKHAKVLNEQERKAASAALGEDSLKRVGTRNLGSLVKSGEIYNVRDAYKAKLARAEAEQIAYKRTSSFDKESAKAKRLAKNVQFLNAKLIETQTLIRGIGKKPGTAKPQEEAFVGPIRPDKILDRYGEGRRILDSLGGRKAIRSVPRDELELVNEGLQKRLQQNLAKLEGPAPKGTSTADAIKRQKSLAAEVSRTSEALKIGKQRLTGFGTASQQTGALFRQFFRYAIGYGIMYKALAAVKALTGGVISLEASLKSIQAITGATVTSMRSIEVAIKRVSLSTKFSTSEVAKAAQILAQAGTEPGDFSSALNSVAVFASATETSIETASDLVSTMRNVFTDLDDLTISNQLTKAVNISKLTGEDLKTILSRGAQVAKGYGLAGEQFLGAVTVLRNAGLKASTVATGLRQGIIELLSPDAKTIKVLEKRYADLGQSLSKKEIQDKFFAFGQADNPLVAVLKEFKSLGFSGAAKADFQRIFDVRAVNAVNALIDSLDDLQAAEAKITFGNSALSAAQTQMESLENSAKNLGAAITVLAADMSGGLVGGLESAADAATELVQKLTEVDSTLKATTGTGVATAVGAGLTTGVLAGLKGGSIKGIAGNILGGTAIGTGVAYAGAKGVEAAGGSKEDAQTVSILSAFGGLVLFDALKALSSKIKTVVTESKFMAGTFDKLGKKMGTASKALSGKGFGFLAAFATFGSKSPFLLGLAALGALIFTIGTFLTGNPFTSAKEKLEQALKNYEAAKAVVDETDTAALEFTLGEQSADGSTSAAPGTTAAQVERLRDNARDYNSAVKKVFEGTEKDFEKVSDLLVRLDREGAEKGLPVRTELLKQLKVFAINKDDFGETAENLQLVTDLASARGRLVSVTKGLQASLRIQIIRINEVTGELSIVDQAIKDAAGELATDSTDFEVVNDLIRATPEQLSAAMVNFLNRVVENINESEVAQENIATKDEVYAQKLKNARLAILAATSNQEAISILGGLVSEIAALEYDVKTFLQDIVDVLQTTRQKIIDERGGFKSILNSLNAFPEIPESTKDQEVELAKLEAKQKAAKDFKAVGRVATQTKPRDLSGLEEARLEELRTLLRGQAATGTATKIITAGDRSQEEDRKSDQLTVDTARPGIVEALTSRDFQGAIEAKPDEIQRLIKEFIAGDLKALKANKDAPGTLEETTEYKEILQVYTEYTRLFSRKVEALKNYELDPTLDADIVAAKKELDRAKKQDPGSLTFDDVGNPLARYRDAVTAKAAELQRVYGEAAADPSHELNKQATSKLAKAKRDFGKAMEVAGQSLVDANIAWQNIVDDFDPKKSRFNAEIFRVREEKKTAVKSKDFGTAQTLVREEETLKLAQNADVIEVLKRKQQSPTQTIRLKATQDLAAATQKTIEIQTAADNEIKRLTTDTKNAAVDLRKKLVQSNLDAVTDTIKLAFDSGSFDVIPALQKERINLLKKLNQVELDDLRIKGASKAELTATADAQKRILDATIRQAYAAETIAAAVEQDLQRREARLTTGSLAKDAAREVSGFAFSDQEKIRQLDTNIPLREEGIATTVAARDLAVSVQETPQARLDVAISYAKEIEDMQVALEELKAQRNELNNNIGTELQQGFSFENAANGLANVDSRMNNLGETINDEVVGGMDAMGASFANALVEGESLFGGLKQIVGDSMRQIAKDIAQSGINTLFQTGLTAAATYFGGAGKKKGGIIKAAKGYVGGVIMGRGTGTSDSISGVVVDGRGRATKGIQVSNREAIVTAAAVKAVGEDFIHFMNREPAKAAAALKAAYGQPLLRAAGGAVASRRTMSNNTTLSAANSTQFNYNSDIKVEGDSKGGQDASALTRLGQMIDVRAVEIIQREKRAGGILSR